MIPIFSSTIFLEIPEKIQEEVEEIFRKSFNISVITKIEFLGWKKHTEEGFKKAKEFLESSNVILITEKLVDKTIDIRRKHDLKLPDAVIASTAIENNFTLVTRNEEDFKHVKELDVFNPFLPEAEGAEQRENQKKEQ